MPLFCRSGAEPRIGGPDEGHTRVFGSLAGTDCVVWRDASHIGAPSVSGNRSH